MARNPFLQKRKTLDDHERTALQNTRRAAARLWDQLEHNRASGIMSQSDFDTAEMQLRGLNALVELSIFR